MFLKYVNSKHYKFKFQIYSRYTKIIIKWHFLHIWFFFCHCEMDLISKFLLQEYDKICKNFYNQQLF